MSSLKTNFIEDSCSSLQSLNSLREKAKNLKLEVKNSVEKEEKKVNEFMVTYFRALMDQSAWGMAIAKLYARNAAMKEGYSSGSIELLEKFYDVSNSINSHPLTIQKREEEAKKASEENNQRRKANQLERQEKQLEEDCGTLKTMLKITAISIVALSVLQIMIEIFLGKPDGKM